MSVIVNSLKTWYKKRPSSSSFPTSHLETWSERKRRKAALAIIHFKTLIYFSVVAMVMPPTWPYLQSIDPNAPKTLVGWIIIGVPALRPINALLVGWILRHFSIRSVTVVSGVFVMISCVMWSTAYNAPIYGGYWLLFSRFVIGFFGAEFQIGTTHIGAATTHDERSTAMTILAGCLSMAYMMAPGVMSLISYVGAEGVLIGGYRLNMYTTAGWLGFVAYGVSLLLFLVYYEENDIAIREASVSKQVLQKESETDTSAKPLAGEGDDPLLLDKNIASCESSKHNATNSGGSRGTDYVAVAVCNLMAAHCYGWLQLPDTMMTVMLMDLLAWDEQTAVRRAGNLLTIFGLLALVGFVMAGRLAKRYPERALMLAGNIIYLLSSLAMLPVDTTPAEYFFADSGGNGTELRATELTADRQIRVTSRGGHSYIATLIGPVIQPLARHIRLTRATIATGASNSTYSTNLTTTTATIITSTPPSHPFTTLDYTHHTTPHQQHQQQQLGCPASVQPWCADEPRPHLIQLAVSFCLSMLGTPFVLPMVNSAVSKLLPPGNQSFMWGVVNGSANIGRLIYPLLNVYVYTYYGPRLQYTVMIALSAAVLLLQLVVYRRLKPVDKNSAEEAQKMPLTAVGAGNTAPGNTAPTDYGTTRNNNNKRNDDDDNRSA